MNTHISLKSWTVVLAAAGALSIGAAAANAQRCGSYYRVERSSIVHSTAYPGSTVVYVEPVRHRRYVRLRHDYAPRRHYFEPRHHTSHRRFFAHRGHHRSHTSVGHHGRRHIRHGYGHHSARSLRFRHR